MHKSVYNWPIYQYLVVFIDILILGTRGFGLLMYVAVRTNMYNSLTLDALEVIHLLRCKI